MLDSKYLTDKIDELIQGLQKRNADTKMVEGLTEKVKLRKRLVTETEQLKASRNQATQEIAVLKKQGADASARIAEMKAVSDRIKEADGIVAKLEEELKEMSLNLPNIPHHSVPFGKGAEDNKVEKVWGEIPKFSFTPKDHVALAEKLNILDTERAAKLTGARFAILKGIGARLERALIQFMLDIHTQEHGYTELWTPLMVNRASLIGTGQLPKFEEDLFKLQGENEYYLIPTAEVPVTNIYRDEILEPSQVPTSYTAYTPCFRSEAGSYGRDTRGLIRQHQFDKVELVKFSHPDQSESDHEALTRHAEVILERLNLPYRRMLLCGGDMGFGSTKTYDLEVWLPSAQTYREISSCSNFGDFQARRAQIRFRPAAGEKPRYVHTLNGSGLAVGRTWLAILENYQREDGSIVVPQALRPYLGQEVLTPPAAR